jgi:hypothetical protein
MHSFRWEHGILRLKWTRVSFSGPCEAGLTPLHRSMFEGNGGNQDHPAPVIIPATGRSEFHKGNRIPFQIGIGGICFLSPNFLFGWFLVK